jgi:hypothetical protein
MASTKPYINQRRWRIIADKIHDEWCIENGYPIKIQAPSFKQQAASNKRLKSQAKVSSSEQQASSPEQRASSNKPRASSSKISFPS